MTGEVYGVWGTPTTYFINRRGQLVGHIVGPRAWESPAARQLILALLEVETLRLPSPIFGSAGY